MTKLPRSISGKQVVNAFTKIGYEVDHQTGSHIILYHVKKKRLTIPNHKNIKVGTLAD